MHISHIYIYIYRRPMMYLSAKLLSALVIQCSGNTLRRTIDNFFSHNIFSLVKLNRLGNFLLNE